MPPVTVKDRDPKSPSSETLKVFISYSRQDMAFAKELVQGLEVLGGFDVSIDTESIHEGEDWQARLANLIVAADAIVFVLSPKSAVSPICHWEVEEAERMSKRILPAQVEALDGIKPPEQLSALHYVRFDPRENGQLRSFMEGLKALARALSTDIGWLREHTRLLVRAREWISADRAQNRLLSGGDIVLAKDWLEHRPTDAPAPTEIHHDFISASEKAEETRVLAERERVNELKAALQTAEAATLAAENARVEQTAASRLVVKRTAAGLVASLMLALAASSAGYIAYLQRQDAAAQRDIANKQKLIAQKYAAEAKLYAEEVNLKSEEIRKLVKQIYTALFGPPEQGPIKPLRKVKFPEPLPLAWDKDTKIGAAYVHEKIACNLEFVFAKLHAEGLFRLLHSYGGAYDLRKLRGSDKWSRHAWGIALDFDPDNNRLRWGRDRARFAKPEYVRLHEIFEEGGFFNMGRRNDFDWNHFEIRLEAVYDPKQRPPACERF